MLNYINQIANSYGTNPLIFLAIYILSIPFYWYGWYIIASVVLSKKNSFINILKNDKLIKGISINRAAWISPYAYVVFSGKSLPLWFWLILVAWLVFGLLIFSRRLREPRREADMFWSVYSWFYDSLNYFTPYKRLMAKLIEYLDSTDQDIIVDVGCGTGNLISRISKYFKIIAIDNNQEMLKMAASKLKNKDQVSLIKHDIGLGLPLDSGFADAIVCSNVVYTIDNPALLIEEFGRVLKTGGRLVVTNPIKEGIWPIVVEHFSKSSPIEFFKSVIALPFLLVVLLLNLIINKKVSAGKIVFLTEQDIIKIVSKFFDIEEITYAYGHENIVILARRR